MVYGPINGIFIARSHAELVAVGATDQDGVFRQQSLYGRSGIKRREPFEDLGGCGYLMACIANIVFQANDYTKEPPDRIWIFLKFPVQGFCLRTRFVGPHLDVGIEKLVLFNLKQVMLHHRPAGRRAVAEGFV